MNEYRFFLSIDIAGVSYHNLRFLFPKVCDQCHYFVWYVILAITACILAYYEVCRVCCKGAVDSHVNGTTSTINKLFYLYSFMLIDFFACNNSNSLTICIIDNNWWSYFLQGRSTGAQGHLSSLKLLVQAPLYRLYKILWTTCLQIMLSVYFYSLNGGVRAAVLLTLPAAVKLRVIFTLIPPAEARRFVKFSCQL
jgi:hypothetical protein